MTLPTFNIDACKSALIAEACPFQFIALAECDSTNTHLMRLAETADVVIEAFRPGVADRLGIGYQHIAARAPQIVYASISAFGQSGPYRDVAAHDIATEAMAGVLSITRGRDGAPAGPRGRGSALPRRDMP